MLVFLSDLHLGDGTSGETIPPSALRVLVRSVGKLAAAVDGIHEIKLVLLGDIFDLTGSASWLHGDVRPWDEGGLAQNEKVDDILAAILGSPDNAESLRLLQSLREVADLRGVPFFIDYVTGNHDRLINRYPSAVAATAAGLGWRTPPPRFRDEVYFPDYRAYACHGDRYETFSSNGGDQYRKVAPDAQRMQAGEVKFVLHGRAHGQVVPVSRTQDDAQPAGDRICFNTGTWRKTWNRSGSVSADREFVGRHLLTCVALFRPGENGGRTFEIWRG